MYASRNCPVVAVRKCHFRSPRSLCGAKRPAGSADVHTPGDHSPLHRMSPMFSSHIRAGLRWGYDHDATHLITYPRTVTGELGEIDMARPSFYRTDLIVQPAAV